MKGAFLSRCISWVVLMALLVLGVSSKPRVLADSGATWTVCASGCDYISIQAAINAANAGDTIQVQAGTYNEYLSITKSIILEGIGTNQVTLNATVTNGYGVYIKADSVTVKGLTIIGNSSTYYGIKAEGSLNLTLKDLVVKQYGRSGIDLNGCTNSLIDTVTAQANGGAGIAITNSTAITMQYLTTSDNSWGGVALFTAPGPYTPGLSNITLTGTNSFGEVNPLYVQLADASHSFTGFSQNEFAYIVRNTAAPLFTWYQKDTSSVLSFINDANSVSPGFRNTAAIQRLSDGTFHVLSDTLKIQPAIDLAAPGGTVYVYPGTYTENVRITKNISLLSTAGRENTTIQGISGQGALGTLWISNATTGVKIGDDNHGFKIVGIDNGNPAVENAAIYFQGSHSNAVIKGNEIVANGDFGLLTEAEQTITGFVIDSNIFSGKTFQGDTPAGDGFGQQFELSNVPRQLVVINGPNASSVTFTNNQVTGTAGGFNADGNPQGNTLVTIDAQNSTIEGNTFEGTTSRYATSLRARKAGTTIRGNVFKSTGLLSLGTGHLYLENNAIDSTLITNNTFDKGVYIENPNRGTVGISVQVFAANAPSNSVIHILPGTYEEQVVVTSKTLTLQGEGTNQSDVVIKSPTTLTAKFTTSVDNKPVVLVQNGANVTLQNLTVDGAGRGNTNYGFIGIGFYNAGGTVENVTITGVRETPFSGAQHGTGIYAYNGDGSSRVLTVRNTTVSDFQKNGITVVRSGLTATIESNTITGAGATSTIAQNGIQVSYGAAATVKDNTIEDIAYSGSGWVSTGILVYKAGSTTVEGNALTNSQASIYVIESSATVRQNRISAPACVGEGCYGIIASDPLSARPSPLEEALAPTAPTQPNRSGGFTLLGGTNPLDTVTVTANEISGALYANGESIGLGVYEGYADRDVAFSASQNVISGWSYGVYVGRCEGTCSSGRLRTFALNDNAITNNSTGMQSDI
ncbi:right-handed parallel beta-helix repeat-containing protein, partial [uncultured Thermanaerothrix sp.]|uniref:right-handed parallel beta-helix repeat-containing protein n=1 Tax=uncultured Thermanaerothrix sp. TaxID=1195149 RepID=UPI002605F7FE